MTTDLAFVHTLLDFPKLELLGCQGKEAINGLYRYEAFVACHSPRESGWEALLRQPCALVLGSGPGELVCGVVASVRARSLQEGVKHLHIEVVPSVALLDRGRLTRAFRDASLDEMVAKIFQEHGMQEGVHYHMLSSTLGKRPLAVQRDESDWAFVDRWLRHYGMCSWFEHTAEGEVLFIADELPSDAASTVTLLHAERNNLQLGQHAIADVEERVCLRERAVCVHDVDLDQPQANHVFSAGEGNDGFGTIHHYGLVVPASVAKGKATSADEGKLIAARRKQRLAVEAHRHLALTNHPGLRAGARLTTELDGRDRTLRITALEWSVGRFNPNDEDSRYVATATLHDATVPYRPEPPERTWPQVAGVELAFVEGAPRQPSPPTGETHPAGGDDTGAYPDAEGRYVVRLASASPGFEPLTMPVRVAQLTSGVGEATHFPLRPGTPVLVAYENGDPDRPYLVAAVAQTNAAHPVSAAANAYRAVLRSATGATIELADQAASHAGH